LPACPIPNALYIPSQSLYVTVHPNSIRKSDMRAEIENVVDEIKQAISLLRRHL
jgi:hypothetical protein